MDIGVLSCDSMASRPFLYFLGFIYFISLLLLLFLSSFFIFYEIIAYITPENAECVDLNSCIFPLPLNFAFIFLFIILLSFISMSLTKKYAKKLATGNRWYIEE